MVDYYERDETHVMDTTSTRVDPATKQLQEAIEALLIQIEANTDEIEVKLDAGNISIDNVDIDMDDVEALLQDLKDLVGEVDANPTSNTVQDRLKSLYTKLSELDSAFDGTDFATESTLDSFKTANAAALASLEGVLSAFKAEATIDATTIATAVEDAATAICGCLTALQTSNETHSDEEQAAIASLEAAVTAFKDAFDARDLATETTQAAFKSEAHTDSLDEQAAIDELKAVEQAEHDETQALLQSEFDATQSLLQTEFDETQTAISDASTQSSSDLQDVEDAVDEFHTDFDNRDLATETSLAYARDQLDKRTGQVLKHDQRNDEDLFTDEVVVGTTTTLFVCIAPIGTAFSSPVWEIVRRKEVVTGTTTQTLVEYRSNVAVDNRTDPTLDSQAAWRTDI